MFNSSFAREMTDYLELRTAVLSASSASNDRRVLLQKRFQEKAKR